MLRYNASSAPVKLKNGNVNSYHHPKHFHDLRPHVQLGNLQQNRRHGQIEQKSQ